jgi:hypothetical protein
MVHPWLAWLGVVIFVVAGFAGLVAGLVKEFNKSIDEMKRDPELQKRIEARKAEEERQRKWRERRDSKEEDP